jgi:hypothetical protein
VHRDAIAIEFARLAKADEAAIAAEKALAMVAAEEQALVAAEAEAWTAWAQNAEGPSPAPRVAEREDITRRRVTAVANLTSIRNAATGLAARRAELNTALASIARDIFQIRVADLVSDATAANEAARSLAEELVETTLKFDSTRIAIVRALASAATANDMARADTLRSALTSIDGLPAPALIGDPAKLDAAIAAVKRRLSE